MFRVATKAQDIKNCYWIIIFVISSLLIGQETETENSIYPKRTIVEPYDLDKGWFFYDDSLFINHVLEDILNNLDPRFFNSGFISGGLLYEETDKTIKKIPVELFADKNNWKVISLFEIDVDTDRIIHGVFLVTFKGDLMKYLNKIYIMSFVKPTNTNEKEGFSIIIEYETPKAENSWGNLINQICRNCK